MHYNFNQFLKLTWHRDTLRQALTSIKSNHQLFALIIMRILIFNKMYIVNVKLQLFAKYRVIIIC